MQASQIRQFLIQACYFVHKNIKLLEYNHWISICVQWTIYSIALSTIALSLSELLYTETSPGQTLTETSKFRAKFLLAQLEQILVNNSSTDCYLPKIWDLPFNWGWVHHQIAVSYSYWDRFNTYLKIRPKAVKGAG